MMPGAKLLFEQLSVMEAECAIMASGHRLEADDGLDAPKADAKEQENNALIARLMKKMLTQIQTGEFELCTLEIKTNPYTTTIEGDKDHA